ncbi:hypothetical protein GC167_02380 [bacterium]|nr:hypothetical protein [bacterium]
MKTPVRTPRLQVLPYWVFAVLNWAIPSNFLLGQLVPSPPSGRSPSIEQRKEYSMRRPSEWGSEAPRIDGRLDDALWSLVPASSDFVMYNPGNGAPEPEASHTEVRMAYDDGHIYFAVRLYDPDPSSIPRELSPRDNFQKNNDWFGFFVNPFNDGLNDFNFWVTAAGVQADSRTTAEGEDFGWNTVWYSAVQWDEQGWTLEVAIPYQSLRFSEGGPEDWGLNMIRLHRREREEYSWNFIDKSVGNPEQQCGLMRGMKNIKPPVRLSLLPYASGYWNAYDGQHETNLRLGMDLKYGLDESFTLDATLVPDFGQVAFDAQVLNTTPFEIAFAENRPFFNEGVDLFGKGDLFYSRRIAGTPVTVSIGDSNTRTLTPVYPQLINAIKVSGRNKNNLGIGVLNAVVDRRVETVAEEEGSTEVEVGPLTNYNILVFDQRFRRNSSVALINLNTWREGAWTDANATGLISTLANRSNTWAWDSEVILTQRYGEGPVVLGQHIHNEVRRTEGQWLYGWNQQVLTNTYDINDLGFLERNNQFNNQVWVRYRIFEPQGAFVNHGGNGSYTHEMLHSPTVFFTGRVAADYFWVLRSFDGWGLEWEAQPWGVQDPFEARQDGQIWNRPAGDDRRVWFSSDYRRPLALDVSVIWNEWWDHPYYLWGMRISPRYRVSDRWSFLLAYEYTRGTDEVGFAGKQGDITVFGERNTRSDEFSIGSTYVFNPLINLGLNARYLRQTLIYDQLYALTENGDVEPISGNPSDYDLNFGSWNLDLRFSWWFAPASELVMLYRNSLLELNDRANTGLGEELQRLWSEPQNHNISLRLVYFLDYSTVFRGQRPQLGT